MSDILFLDFYYLISFTNDSRIALHRYDREEKRRRTTGETQLGRAINLFRIRHL